MTVSRSETRIHQLQAFNIFNNIQAFSQRGREKKRAAFAICTIRGTPRHVCRIFREKKRRSDLPVVQNLSK